MEHALRMRSGYGWGWLLATVVLGGQLTACSSDSAEPAGSATPSVEVVLIAPRQAEACDCIEAIGETVLAPNAVASASFRTDVQVESLLVQVGSRVVVGQPVVRARLTATGARDLAVAKANLQLAASEKARADRLFSQQLMTRDDLDRADNALKAAKSAVAAFATDGASVPNTPIVDLRAPSAGVVTSITAAPGAQLLAGAVALEVADASKLLVRAGLEPSERSRISSGLTATVRSARDKTISVRGVVSDIAAQLDAGTRLLPVWIALDSKATLLPGEPVRVQIELERRANTLQIPQSAVLFDADAPYVFVVVDGKAQRRSVELGVEVGDNYEIRSGLAAGERVVALGNHELEDGMSVRARDDTSPVHAP